MTHNSYYSTLDKISGHNASIGDKILTLFMCAILLTGTAAIISAPSMPVATALTTEEASTSCDPSIDPNCATTTDSSTSPTTETTDSSTSPTTETTDSSTSPTTETTDSSTSPTTETTDSTLLANSTDVTTEPIDSTIIDNSTNTTPEPTTETTDSTLLANSTDVTTEPIDSTIIDNSTNTTPEPTTETTNSVTDSPNTSEPTTETTTTVADIVAEQTQPTVVELDESTNTEFIKELTIFPTSTSEGSITVTTEIPESASGDVQIFQQDGSTFNEITDNSAYSVQLVDTNDNQIPDRIVFEASAEQVQKFVVYAVILATSAEHLDSNKMFIEDVFDKINAKDNNWTGDIPVGDYIRVIFEHPLTNVNDITLFAKSSGGTVEIYQKDSDNLLATIGPINDANTYKVILSNLVGTETTFDLKVVGNPVNFDLITDPNPAANIDQCANGAKAIPQTGVDCTGSAWQNGDLNESKAHYSEGDSVPYRALLTNLLPGSHYIDIEIDIKHQGKHALDFYTFYDRINENVDPKDIRSTFIQSNFTIPPPAVNTTIGTPGNISQPDTAFGALLSAEKVISFFGPTAGTHITGLQYVPNADGNLGDLFASDSASRLRVFFDVNNTDTEAILAWGGHIATAGHWGFGNSAGGISGAPYHSRIIGFDTNGIGNQDRSLQSSAIRFLPAVYTNSSSTGTVFPNTPVHDTVTVQVPTPDSGQPTTATGTVDFFVCGPTGSPTACPILTANFLNTATISGPNNSLTATADSQSISKSALGYYCFSARYNGDNNLLPVNATSVVNECFQVVSPPVTSGQLTLTKIWDNNNTDSTATANNFGLVIKNNTNTFTNLGVVTQALQNGTYTIYENSTLPSSAYSTNSTFSCRDTSIASPPVFNIVNNSNIILNVTNNVPFNYQCEIVNQAVPPQLTLVKTVINNNGGTHHATEWTLSATGTSGSFSGVGTANATSAADDAVKGPVLVKANTQYTLSESSISGYTASSWSCNGGTFVSPDKITLSLGQSVTCSITNDDVAPQLKLVKTVTKDNGGTAVPDNWRLNATGTVGSFSNLGGSGAFTPVNATIQYTLTEEGGPAGYTQATNWSCDAGTFVAPNKITLTEGQSATCTINNDDVAPKLTLIKVWNDNGSGAPVTAAGNFTLTASNSSGTQISGATGVNKNLDVGTYDLDESANFSSNGYETTKLYDCTNGQTATSSVSLVAGDDVTCTVSNTAKLPTLQIIKVSNGGLGTFNFTVSNATDPVYNDTITTAPSGSNSTSAVTVKVGSYSVTEYYKPAGWDLAGITCKVNNVPKSSPITLGLGDAGVCTVVNNKQGQIKIIKDASINDVQDFTFVGNGTIGSFTLDDDEYITDPLPGEELNEWSNSTTKYNLPADAYTITETNIPAGWFLTDIQCVNDAGYPASTFSSISSDGRTVYLAPNGHVTCTFKDNNSMPTRTQGFWKTHTDITTFVWSTKLGSDIHIGSATKHLNNTSKIFGTWYSSIPKMENGTSRTPIDQARMQLATQLLAAKLNLAEFGAPQLIKDQIAAADIAFNGNDINAIKISAAQMDTYNNSGDSLTFDNPGKATPKDSEKLATKNLDGIPKYGIKYWDAMPISVAPFLPE